MVNAVCCVVAVVVPRVPISAVTSAWVLRDFHIILVIRVGFKDVYKCGDRRVGFKRFP